MGQLMVVIAMPMNDDDLTANTLHDSTIAPLASSNTNVGKAAATSACNLPPLQLAN